MERFEMYLKALETGDRSNIPTPRTRLEERFEGILDKYVKKIVNALRGAITETGEPYGTNGYKVGVYVDDNKGEKSNETMCCTGYIPVVKGDVVRMKNMVRDTNWLSCITYYTSDFAFLSTGRAENVFTLRDDGVYEHTVNRDTTAYMRLSFGTIDDTSIVTVNEEIE